jgi:hypothetical protein
VQVVVADGRVRIVHGGTEVAVHAETTGRRQRILDPAHFHGVAGVAGVARPACAVEPAVALPEAALLRPLAEYERRGLVVTVDHEGLLSALSRLKLTAIRDQLDSLLAAARSRRR